MSFGVNKVVTIESSNLGRYLGRNGLFSGNFWPLYNLYNLTSSQSILDNKPETKRQRSIYVTLSDSHSVFNLNFHLCEQNFQDNPQILTVSHVFHIGSTPQGRYRLAAGKKRYRPCSYKTSRWFLLWSINRLPIHILYFFSVHVFQQLFWSQYSTNGVARYLFIQLFFCNISAGHLLWPIKILPIHLYFPYFILAFLTPTPSESNLYQPFDF